MRQHREIFESVRRRTGMWVEPATYDTVVAFVTGYDAACEFGVLAGFREWLIVRSKCEARNFVWPAYVLRIAFPKVPLPGWDALTSEEAHRHAIETLFALIEEFDEAVDKYDGRHDIVRAYDRWGQHLDHIVFARDIGDGAGRGGMAHSCRKPERRRAPVSSGRGRPGARGLR